MILKKLLKNFIKYCMLNFKYFIFKAFVYSSNNKVIEIYINSAVLNGVHDADNTYCKRTP